MNIEDIKVDEIYNVQVKVTNVGNTLIYGRTVAPDGTLLYETNFYRSEACVFSTIPTPPKHDPTRLFKKGDIVRLKEWNGRCPEMYSGTNSWFNHPPRCKNGNLEVREDEKNSKVEIGIIGADCAHAATAPAYLELVTPVEELEPFYVDYITPYDDEDFDDNPRWCVKYRKYDDIVSVFYRNAFEDPEKTRAAAEAECKRLNAEYRKEHGNERN